MLAVVTLAPPLATHSIYQNVKPTVFTKTFKFTDVVPDDGTLTEAKVLVYPAANRSSDFVPIPTT
jgi:hypothetical protein